MSSEKLDFPPGMAPKILEIMQTVNDLETKLKPLLSHPYHEIKPQVCKLFKLKNIIYCVNIFIYINI